MNAPFRNFTPGLVIFGILLLVIAGFMLLGAMSMLFMLAVPRALGPQQVQMPVSSIVAGAAWSLGLAVFFVTMGVGSILARRWARAIMLVVSWVWLVVGALSLVIVIRMWPQMQAMMAEQQPAGAAPPPEGMLLVIRVAMAAMSVFIYVLLPLAFLLFYRSPHTKATCEWKNPAPSWTDRVPLPVLGMSLLLAIGGAGALMNVGYGIVPVFGTVLSGAPAAAVSLVISGIALALAWGTYRLRPAAWWGALAAVAAAAASAALTWARVPMSELYVRMGYPAEQVARLEKFNPWSPAMMVALPVVTGAAAVAYLLWVRRFFTPAGAAPGALARTPPPPSTS